jgi:hypothetical protein
MRKWLCLGIVPVAASCVGGYWLCSKPTAVRPLAIRSQPSPIGEKHDGDAETSDTIEPLVVDQGGRSVTFRPIPLATDEMLPRVLFSPGMSQPPRPDASPGNTLRMPYADEEAILALPIDLDSVEFELEESEPKVRHPPVDYHRMEPHCPYPYYRR